jgi:hypothetical protein
MTELLVNCFEIDGYAAHETSVFARPKEEFGLLCTKNPRDVLAVRPLLWIDRDLWIIHMLRDPRDVVVSRHAKEPDRYWANLRLWRQYHRAACKAMGHARFVTVRYEDLVTEPEGVQEELMRRMPFLVRRAAFRDFHETARPSQPTLEALGGLRPLETASIGAWRRHKPRLAAQLALHGSIAETLIELGYETDDSWLGELGGVTPSRSASRWPEHSTPWRQAHQSLGRLVDTFRYAVGAGPRVRMGGRAATRG